MSQLALVRLRERFGSAIVETHSEFGDDTAIVDPAAWRDICFFLRDDPALDFNLPVDLCGVDYPSSEGVASGRKHPAGRMEVVLHLYSIEKRHRIRLKTRVGGELMEGADLDSATSVWPGLDWLEREVFDMSGVRFRGHPDLRRILMYPEFEGHPLQRTYPASRTQPLVPYRTESSAGMPIDKLEPFGDYEGMPFGRRPTPRLQEDS